MIKPVKGRDYLARKGKRAMGWEECLFGNPDPKAVIAQCWHETKSTRRVLERGYEVVLSPPAFCYFDFPQGLMGDKLRYNGATDVTMERVRAFHPAAGLPDSLTSQILGAECCNWSECTADAAALMFKMWPRTAVFASRLADRSLIKVYRKE